MDDTRSNDKGMSRLSFLHLAPIEQHTLLYRQLTAHYNNQHHHSKAYHHQSSAIQGTHNNNNSSVLKTDFDILKENYRFIRSEHDDASDTWEVRLSKRYFARLYREYAIADLSRYQSGQIGLRWRTENEVISGRGQFCCGAKGCEEKKALASFEVPFMYKEADEVKRALVKVRVCPDHAYQLNYKKNKEKVEGGDEKEKKRRRRRRKREEDEESVSSDISENDDDGHENKRKKKRKGETEKDDDIEDNNFESFLGAMIQ